MRLDTLPTYQLPAVEVLRSRLREPKRFIQIVAGPRQTGKTTLVLQVSADFQRPVHYASADSPVPPESSWITQQWETARNLALRHTSSLLVLDEVQKVHRWSEAVKALWDEDARRGLGLRVVILGSSPVLIEKGLSESLAGRFEVIRTTHWSFADMQKAFGTSLDEYILYGGYPGAVSFSKDWPRWSSYIRDSLIETTISRDILLLSRIDKPALLRRLFLVGGQFSGQIVTFQKLLGQLQDVGNTTTLAHYLDLLGAAGLMTGLPKFSGSVVRRRGSSPKLLLLNTALLTAICGVTPEELRSTPRLWGRQVETAVGAYLTNSAPGQMIEVYYWRKGDAEVDFVLRKGNRVTAIEVKSGSEKHLGWGVKRFANEFRPQRILLVGEGGIPIGDFLATPVSEWLE